MIDLSTTVLKSIAEKSKVHAGQNKNPTPAVPTGQSDSGESVANSSTLSKYEVYLDNFISELGEVDDYSAKSYPSIHSKEKKEADRSCKCAKTLKQQERVLCTCNQNIDPLAEAFLKVSKLNFIIIIYRNFLSGPSD